MRRRMTERPYRVTYRVEERIRELTAEEEAFIRAMREAWHADVAKQARNPLFEVGAGIAGVLVLLLLLRSDRSTGIFGGLLAVTLGGMLLLGWKKSRERIATARGPWDAGAEGFAIRELHVVARSVVSAVSDDEDYDHFLLYEIPGDDWFF